MSQNLCDHVQDLFANTLKKGDPAKYPHAILNKWIQQLHEVAYLNPRRLSATRRGHWFGYVATDVLTNAGDHIFKILNLFVKFGRKVDGEDAGVRSMRGLSFVFRELRPYITEGKVLDLSKGAPTEFPSGMNADKVLEAVGSIQRIMLTVLNPRFYDKDALPPYSNTMAGFAKIQDAMNGFLGTIDNTVREILDLPGTPADKEALREGLWTMLKSIQTPEALGGMWYQMEMMKRVGIKNLRDVEGFLQHQIAKAADPNALASRGLDLQLDASHVVRFIECKFGQYKPDLTKVRQIVNQLDALDAADIPHYRVFISGHGRQPFDAVEHVHQCGGRFLRYAVLDRMKVRQTLSGGATELVNGPWKPKVRNKVLDMLNTHMKQKFGPQFDAETFFTGLKLIRINSRQRPAGVSTADWAKMQEARKFLGNQFFKVEAADHITVGL